MSKMTRKSDDPKWWQNPNIQSALITGFLGLVGTVITVRATRPPTPTPIDYIVDVDKHKDESHHESSNSKPSAASLRPAGYDRVPQQPALDLHLNFAEFQNGVVQVGLTTEQKAKYVAPLVGKTVIWRGYLDCQTMHSEPTDDAYFTLSLVETPEKITQSMFKTPALFRMPVQELEAARALKSGQLLTLSGKLQSHSLIGTILTDGHIVGGNSSVPVHSAHKSLETNQQ